MTRYTLTDTQRANLATMVRLHGTQLANTVHACHTAVHEGDPGYPPGGGTRGTGMSDPTPVAAAQGNPDRRTLRELDVALCRAAHWANIAVSKVNSILGEPGTVANPAPDRCSVEGCNREATHDTKRLCGPCGKAWQRARSEGWQPAARAAWLELRAQRLSGVGGAA